MSEVLESHNNQSPQQHKQQPTYKQQKNTLMPCTSPSTTTNWTALKTTSLGPLARTSLARATMGKWTPWRKPPIRPAGVMVVVGLFLFFSIFDFFLGGFHLLCLGGGFLLVFSLMFSSFFGGLESFVWCEKTAPFRSQRPTPWDFPCECSSVQDALLKAAMVAGFQPNLCVLYRGQRSPCAVFFVFLSFWRKRRCIRTPMSPHCLYYR